MDNDVNLRVIQSINNHFQDGESLKKVDSYRQITIQDIKKCCCVQNDANPLSTDPCQYFDVLKKKTKVVDIFNTDRKRLIKINIESSPHQIWIRIRFLEINGFALLIFQIHIDLLFKNKGLKGSSY